LSWEGFGLLHNGLWIAPSIPDVEKVLAELGPDTAGEVKVFRAAAMPPTDVARLVADAWDLEALAARYSEFVARWGVPAPRPEITDDLARFLLLLTEWLLLVRIDPHLPVQLLPADWPAVEAERLATELRAAYERPAREAFRAFAEHGPVPAD
jgi:phenylacetic acid degradation operon negative regulatory protein